MKSILLKGRHHPVLAAPTYRSMSIFSRLFNREKVEEEAVEEKPEKEEAPVKLQFEQRDDVRGLDLKKMVDELDRSSSNNLYARIEPVRLDKKARNSQDHIQTFLHPDLQAHSRVTIEKYQSKNFKRGLQEGETAFPVQAKIGPYKVSWHRLSHLTGCRSRTLCLVPRTTIGAAVACQPSSRFATGHIREHRSTQLSSASTRRHQECIYADANYRAKLHSATVLPARRY